MDFGRCLTSYQHPAMWGKVLAIFVFMRVSKVLAEGVKLVVAACLLLPLFAGAQTCDLINENFDSGGTPPTGWVQSGSYFNTATPFSGSTHAGFNTVNDQLTLVGVDCPAQICFYWRASGTSSNWDVDIEWSDDSGSNWNIAQTISTNGSGSPTTYAQTCVALPVGSYATSTGILLRFTQSRRSGGSMYLDDVCVSSGVCGAAASEFRFSNVTPGCLAPNNTFSAQVCATDNGGNVDASYVGEVTLTQPDAGATLGGTTTLTFVAGCATFNNLSLDAAGTVVLQADSGSITSKSDSITIDAVCPLVDTVRLMAYNLLNYPDGRDDCGTNITTTNRSDTLRKLINYYDPAIMMNCELQTEAGADSILSRSLNVNGETKWARASFVTNTSPGGTTLNNMLFYDGDRFTLYSQSEVLTNVRDISEYVLYYNDANLADNNDTTWLDVYVSHLKAGSGASNEASREQQIDSLIAHLDKRPAGRYIVFGGDFNLQNSSEQAFSKITTTGTYKLKDPIATSGNWHNNATYAAIHTQSTRALGSTPIECGSTGGCDDRFDFILANDSVLCSGRMDYLTSTYQAGGNDGSIFNLGVDNVANTSVPDTVKNALYNMSDHLPVFMDVQITLPTPITLAVELLAFNAQLADGRVLLDWSTASELNSDRFVVERSADGRRFENVFELPAAGTSSQKLDYNGVDDAPLPGRSFYRLVEHDVDGQQQISKLRTVVVPDKRFLALNRFAQGGEGMALEIASNPKFPVRVEIRNALGQLVYARSLHRQAAIHQQMLYPGSLPGGVYFLQLSNGGEQLARRFVQLR